LVVEVCQERELEVEEVVEAKCHKTSIFTNMYSDNKGHSKHQMCNCPVFLFQVSAEKRTISILLISFLLWPLAHLKLNVAESYDQFCNGAKQILCDMRFEMVTEQEAEFE
jgi:hypothetical protein